MDITAWLRDLGLEEYGPAFRDNALDAEVLPELTEAHLERLGLPLGHRLKLLKAIRELGTAARREPPSQAVLPPLAPSAAERRQLTIMFCDLVGSTALSGRLDPEDMREVLTTYQNAVAGEVSRFEGFVAKLMGDGVLAYFGWPRAHEDEAERAVRAGLSIVSTVPRLATPAGEPLATRVGIATGLVVVGDLVGQGAAQEQAVIGETPNLAARLQEVASPGAVVLSDATRRRLGQVFELRELEPVRLKGFEHPVPCFLTLGERPAGSRFEAHQSGELLPMVGREQELALVLERWRQAAAGEGQAVLLVGEAGIGKSRLVQAALDAVRADEHTALRYQCSPHHTSTALWPVVEQLRVAAGFEPADSDPVRLDKLEALLRRGVEDVSNALPLVAALLGVGAGAHYPALDFTPQQLRVRTLAALVEQLRGLARQRPVLMVLEDAHWIDPTTRDLLGVALDRIAGARVLILLTSRPDGQPTLSGHPHVTRLTLTRLGRGPTEAIMARLTGGRRLPPEVLSEIAARTDGVPLFIEELTKAVVEVGTVAAGAAVVPASLHASLLARLDRVPGVMAVTQAAACIGREFPGRLLAAVSPLSEAELRAALDRLVAAELVLCRGEPPEMSYTFKHALVRDAAEASLLKRQRQRLHARIAEVLEADFPETIEREPELIARHCTEAGLHWKAVEYRQKAGQQALARSAMAEAVAQLTEGLKALAALPNGAERPRRELDLQLALGGALIAARGYGAPETGLAYARARELCRELGDTPELFPALYGLHVFHSERGELAVADEIARELLRSAEQRGDAAAMVTGHRLVGKISGQLGKFPSARAHAEEALARYDPVRDRTSRFVYTLDPRAMCLIWLSHALLALGYPEQARARAGEAIAHARDLAHPPTLAEVLDRGCTLHPFLRDRNATREWADALVALATEHGFPLWLTMGRAAQGWALADAGQSEEGLARIRRSVAEYRATGSTMLLPDLVALLADVPGPAELAATRLGLLDEALDQVARTGGRWLEAELLRLRGETLLCQGRRDGAGPQACFERAVAVAKEQGAKWWELRAARSLAGLWAERGERRRALDLLAPVYAWFTEGLDTEDLRRTKGLLDALP